MKILCRKIYHKVTKCIVRLVPRFSKINATAVFTKEEFKEYIDRERYSTAIYLTTFNKNERLVLYCKYYLLWGRERIRSKTGLSERFINDVVRKLVSSDKVVMPTKRSNL